jgi:hypothetical protein
VAESVYCSIQVAMAELALTSMVDVLCSYVFRCYVFRC